MLNTVFLAFGANLGDRKSNIEKACALLEGRGAVINLLKSSYYETEPLGFKSQPWFLNSVATAQTELTAESLFKVCREIEVEIGRLPRDKWHEREIDIDILFFGDEVISSSGIEIPHPRLHERKFVLLPASEIAPDFIHPVFNLKLSELLDKCSDDSELRKLST